MPDRIDDLIRDHEMLKRDHNDYKNDLKNLTKSVASLTGTLGELSKQQIETDKSISKLTHSLNNHFKDEAKTTSTLDAIDNNVNQIKIDMSGLLLKQHEEIQKAVNPLFSLVRENKKDIAEHKLKCEVSHNEMVDSMKKEIEGKGKAHLKMIWTVAIIIWGVISSAAGFVYTDLKEDIRKNTMRSEKNAMSLVAKKNILKTTKLKDD